MNYVTPCTPMLSTRFFKKEKLIISGIVVTIALGCILRSYKSCFCLNGSLRITKKELIVPQIRHKNLNSDALSDQLASGSPKCYPNVSQIAYQDILNSDDLLRQLATESAKGIAINLLHCERIGDEDLLTFSKHCAVIRGDDLSNFTKTTFVANAVIGAHKHLMILLSQRIEIKQDLVKYLTDNYSVCCIWQPKNKPPI